MNGQQIRIPREMQEVFVAHLLQSSQPQERLDRESIRRIINNTVQTENDTEQCPVCLETFEEGMTVVETPCNHKFHNNCISRWLQSHSTCPVCRASLTEQSGNLKIKFIFPNNFELHTEWNLNSNSIIDIFIFLTHFPTNDAHNYVEIELGTRTFKSNEPYNSLMKLLKDIDLVQSINCTILYRL